MARPKPIDPEILRENFYYDNGKLFHKNGKQAGCLSRGYLRVGINYKTYPVHRVIWSLVNGEDPGSDVIDHIDGDKLNNNIDNLRKVGHQINQYNKEARGYRKRGNSYQALIKVDGKLISLGSFPTAEEAQAKYNTTKKELCLR